MGIADITYEKARRAATTTDPYAPFWAFYGIDPNSPQAALVKQLVADGNAVVDAFEFVAERAETGPYAPKAPSGGGGAAPAFAGTEEGLRLQAQLQAEADARAAAAQAERDRLQREFTERMDKIQTLTSLAQEFARNRQQARLAAVQLRQDPFAQSSFLAGTVSRGVSPAQQARTEAEQFASLPTPQINPNASLGDINALISQLTGLQTPQFQAGFGLPALAGGGYVPEGGAVVTGEAGKPEIVINRPGGAVEVIPIYGEGQTGGTFQFDPLSAETTLGPLYQSLGIPREEVYPAAGQALPQQTLSRLSRFGISPQLVGVPGGAVFYRENGTYRHIVNEEQLARLGFHPQDIFWASNPQDIASVFGQQGPEIGAGSQINLPSIARPGAAFGSLPYTTPGGFLLPNPWVVARTLQALKAANLGQLPSGLLSAYSSANITPEMIETLIGQATPTGFARQPVGLR